MKFAIIGYGGRGMVYEECLKKLNGEISAVCDINPEKIALAKKNIGLADTQLFLSEDTFFEKKRGDVLMICTQDALHLRHAKRALALGYDLLLEKPIATNVADCDEILQAAKAAGRQVFVCHVLRYAPFFNEIKRRIDSGKYGKVVTISLTENVAYWHQAHSFVRGEWRNDETSNPMIIAKCCHDLDLLCWFVNEKCESVSSFGSLQYFNPAHAPEGAAKRCLNCKHIKSCPYSAERIYIKDRAEKGDLLWPCDAVVPEPTVEKLYEVLKMSPYGRCVYTCDNNVVDHQVVNMLFEGGATAQLTMTAFSKDCYRQIHIHCEKGEIYGNNEEGKLYCNLFGGEQEVVDVNIGWDTAYGHGGGDWRMVADIIDGAAGKGGENLTSIEKSIQSHYIGFAAEESRQKGGVLIRVDK